jgi:glycosyltransferase involved in cell wall biosynthesis
VPIRRRVHSQWVHYKALDKQLLLQRKISGIGVIKVRIGIDGRALQIKRAGVGRYVFELCRALDLELCEAEFIVYSQHPIEMPVQSARWINRVELAPWASRMKSALWLKLRAGNLCKQDKLDAYWANATLIPTLPKSVNVVSTVHDLNYLVVPETMSSAGYWAARIFFSNDVSRANQVLVNSQGTADRLYKLLGRQADGVVFPSIDEHFKPQPPEVVASTLNRLGLDKPYLLAIGNLEPRKNLELLISVFENLRCTTSVVDGCNLVLAGGAAGWKNAQLKKMLEQHDSGVKHLGFVNDSDLPSLYSGTMAFVFPSIYEGFGMPVLEARACGAKVVASDIPEIREAGGEDGVLYTQPTMEGLSMALQKILLHPSHTILPQSLPKWSDGAKTLAAALLKNVRFDNH